MAARGDYVTKKDLEAYATKKDLEAWRDALQDDIRAIGVMFEQTRSDLKGVAELVLGCATKTDVQRLDTNVASLSTRLSNVEAAVREHSGDSRLLRNEVAQLRLQLDRRDLRGDELERRIAEIEKRMGIAR